MIPPLRAWLRNECRLGVPHYPIAGIPRPPAAPSGRAGSARRTATKADQNLPRPATPPRPPAPASRQAAFATPTPDRFPDNPDLPPPCDRELSRDEAEVALTQLNDALVKSCTRCRLHEQRQQAVFGAGHARPELVFVGEGPGADEDAQGIPFVGRAGQLLTRMIAAMNLTREQVYIANIVKCRPPGNRTPVEDEMHTCGPYLFRQLAILRPKVIVTLGRPASQTLLATKTTISRLRGEFHVFPPPELAHFGLPTTKLMPTFHPAYLLRNPSAKGDAWSDLQQVMQLLGL